MLPAYTDPKQDSEKLRYTLSAASTLATGDTISSIEIKAFDASGTDVTSTIISGTPSFVGTSITLWVQAGTSGNHYDLRLRITTTLGELIEDDLILVVQNRS